MLDIIKTIVLVLEILILVYFTYAVAYNFLLSFAGLFYKSKTFSNVKKEHKIAVIVAAYKEDAVIREVALKACEQSYPSDKFDVIIAADSMKESTLKDLYQMPIIVQEVKFEKSTKVKALNAVLGKQTDYDIAVILDGDNIMEHEFLEKINGAYDSGLMAMQGRRVAKNSNTSFSILDALSEIINNHVFRQGTVTVGWSCNLIGSGMAFDFSLLRDTLSKIDSVGGFDKELQITLTTMGHKIAYLKNATVQDEKIESAEVFENQRRRWMSTQFIYLRHFAKEGIISFFKLKWGTFNMIIMQHILLPRFINLGLLTIITILATIFRNYLSVPALTWWILYAFNTLGILFAIPVSFYNKDFFKALLSLPKAFAIMLSLLFKLRGANERFIHTPHSGNGDKKQ